jgi:hypothetical protein
MRYHIHVLLKLLKKRAEISSTVLSSMAIYSISYMYCVGRIQVLEFTSSSGCNELESKLPDKSLKFSGLSPFVFWCCIIPILIVLGTTSGSNLITKSVATRSRFYYDVHVFLVANIKSWPN